MTSVEREGLVFVKKAEKKEQILDQFSLSQWYICDKQASSSFRRQYVTVHCLCHFRCAAASVKVSVPLPHSLVLITKVNLGIFSGDLFPKNTSSTRVPLSHSKKLTLSVFVTSRLCWVVSVKLSVPYPAAAWSSVCTGW